MTFGNLKPGNQYVFLVQASVTELESYAFTSPIVYKAVSKPNPPRNFAVFEMEVDKEIDENNSYKHSMTLTWDYPDFDGGESVTNYRIDWN